jgi:UrcA family protein
MNASNRLRRAGSGIVASVAATVGLLLATPPARASDDVEVTSIRIQYADLDLSTAHGVRELYSRLSGAAMTACGDDVTLEDISQLQETENCRQAAIEKAVARIDRPMLTALYDRHFPKEPLTPALRVSLASKETSALAAR